MSDLILQEHDLGLTWVHGDEAMRRASHALVDDGRVWIIDPTDEDEAMDRVATLGEPAAVLQLLDRHNRDCAQLARRLQVPHISLPEVLPQAPFDPFWVVRRKGWNEVALDWPGRKALIVAEAVGTGPYFTVGGAAVGVHPLLRLRPPRSLARPALQHLLVGHGEGVHGRNAAVALKAALDHSRRDIPRLLIKLPFAARG
ncbi:MAG: hypothetical protein ACXVFN_01430 [Solirubrobacteraceae bacterium]